MTELTQKHILEGVKQLAQELAEIKRLLDRDEKRLDRIENVAKGGAGARK